MTQIHKRQARPTELLIEPDADVMQSHLGRQGGLEATQFMRPFPIEAEHMLKAGSNRFDDWADASQPTPPSTRPRTRAVAPGRTANLSPIGVPPVHVPRRSCKALLSDIRPLGGSTDTAQARVGPMGHRQASASGWSWVLAGA